jgi:hypothetical protein
MMALPLAPLPLKVAMVYPSVMTDAKTKPVEDGTEADFRDLLDFACTTPAKPASQPAPTGKPEIPSAQSSE